MASYDKIKEYIEKAIFYDREYDVINTIMTYADPRFFAKILEEVVDGNMYWVDFYPILNTPSYREMLSSTMMTQEELLKEFKIMSDFRENVVYNNNLGIYKTHDKHAKLNKMYNDEKIFNILQSNASDNAMTIACKEAMYNAIKNYELMISRNSDSNTYNDIVPNRFGELQQWDEDNNTIEYFSYINPDDILVSADDMIIPIDSRFQTLDDSDRAFMMENNIGEEEMKQFKALRMFLTVNGGGI